MEAALARRLEIIPEGGPDQKSARVGDIGSRDEGEAFSIADGGRVGSHGPRPARYAASGGRGDEELEPVTANVGRANGMGAEALPPEEAAARDEGDGHDGYEGWPEAPCSLLDRDAKQRGDADGGTRLRPWRRERRTTRAERPARRRRPEGKSSTAGRPEHLLQAGPQLVGVAEALLEIAIHAAAEPGVEPLGQQAPHAPLVGAGDRGGERPAEQLVQHLGEGRALVLAGRASSTCR